MKQDIDIAMTANLEVMQTLTAEALGHIADALYEVRRGERNAAIGSMPDTGKLLEQAAALFTATRALHRAGRAP